VTAPSSPELDDIDSNFRDTRIPGLKREVDGANAGGVLQYWVNSDAAVKAAMNV